MEEIYKMMDDFKESKQKIVRQNLHIEHLEDESKEYEKDEHVYQEYVNTIKKEKESLKKMDLDYKKFGSDANIAKVVRKVTEIQKEREKKSIEIKRLKITLENAKIDYLEFLSNPDKDGKLAQDFLNEQAKIEKDIETKENEIKTLDAKIQEINEFLLEIKGIELTIEERKEINKEENKIIEDEPQEKVNESQEKVSETQEKEDEPKEKVSETQEKEDEPKEKVSKSQEKEPKEDITTEDSKARILIGKMVEIYNPDGEKIELSLKEYKKSLKMNDYSKMNKLLDVYNFKKANSFEKRVLKDRFDKIIDKVNPTILFALEKLEDEKMVWDYVTAIEEGKKPKNLDIIYNENSYKKRTIFDKIKALPFINKALNKKEINKISTYAEQDDNKIATVLHEGETFTLSEGTNKEQNVKASNRKTDFIKELKDFELQPIQDYDEKEKEQEKNKAIDAKTFSQLNQSINEGR